MYLLELAQRFFKVTKTKSVKFLSTHRETKSSQLVLIKPAVFGTQKMELNTKCSMVTKTKSSPAHLTTRETPSSQGQRTTPAEFGRTKTSLRN
jgi:hypothetical protein